MVQIPQGYLEKKDSLYEAAMSYNPMPIPDPPSEVSLFRELPRPERERTSDKFYSQDFVIEYFEAKWKAELHNKYCFEFIWEGYKRVNNPKKKDALRARLSLFKVAILSTPRPYRALKMDMSKYSFIDTTDKGVMNVVEMFGGKVV